METKQEEMIGVNGAADILGVEASTIRKWILKRTVPYYKIGRRVVFKVPELLQLREECRVEPSGCGAVGGMKGPRGRDD